MYKAIQPLCQIFLRNLTSTFLSTPKYSLRDVTDKIVVITGASSGIGKQVAFEMAKRQAVVVMACRNLESAEEVVATIKSEIPDARLFLVHLDLADLSSVEKCAATIQGLVPHINLLLNNAGIMDVSAEIKRNKRGIEQHMATNYLGHFALTMLLMNSLRLGSPSRVVVVSSFLGFHTSEFSVHDWNLTQPKEYGNFNLVPYSNSKICLAFFVHELSKRLRESNINVKTYGVCPGIVKTNIFRSFHWMYRLFLVDLLPFSWTSLEEAANAIVYCSLAEENAAEAGKMYRDFRRWSQAETYLLGNEDISQKLFDISLSLLKEQIPDLPNPESNVLVSKAVDKLQPL